MPKDTFFNLPLEKRKRIEDAAINEFSNYNYDASSINRIVENSDIAKGSFYQYFEDKKDLYKHIIDIIVEKKLEHMSPVMQNPFNHNIFTLIREIFISGLSFAEENPELLEIGNKLLADTTHSIYKEILADNKGKSDEVFQMLLSKAVERGEVRQGIDLKMISYLLTAMNINIVDYYTSLNKKREYNKDMLEVVDKLIDFIQYGISKRGDGAID